MRKTQEITSHPFCKGRREIDMKVKKVFKYATGQPIPEGAIYLATLKNGRRVWGAEMPSFQGSFKSDMSEYVWHYFLVEVEEQED